MSDKDPTVLCMISYRVLLFVQLEIIITYCITLSTIINYPLRNFTPHTSILYVLYHDSAQQIVVIRYYGQHCDISSHKCHYTVISSATNSTKTSKTPLVTVNMTFLRCSRSTSAGTIHIRVDSVLKLTLTT